MKKIIFTGLSALMILASCSKADNKNQPTTQLPNKVKLGDTYAAGIKATLWCDTTLQVGYNKLYVTLADSATGVVVNNASTAISLKMPMGNMTMSGPAEQPVYNTASQMYEGAAVFTMATGNGNGQWTIDLQIQNNNGQKADGILSVDVANRSFTPFFEGQGSDGQTYVITMLQPKLPKFGMNTFEVLVSKQIDDTHYTAVDNLVIDMTAQMPSMTGMDSPNNQDPTGTGNGHYSGKLSMDMTGAWQIDLNIKQAGVTLFDDAYFQFSF